MYEEMTAAGDSYLDITWQVAALYWGSSQRLARLQTDAGLRLLTESADSLSGALSKKNGDRSIADWNALYLTNATRVFDITCRSLDEVKKVRTEVAQVIDDYTEAVADQARQQNTDDPSTRNGNTEKVRRKPANRLELSKGFGVRCPPGPITG